MGRISKTHGYNGGVVLVSDQAFNDDVERLEEIFVVVDGLQVPFPVKEFELVSDTSAHLQLEFVETKKEALELVDCEVFATTATHVKKMETGWKQWLGFAVNDAKYGTIGVIRQIEDYKGNIVMQVMDGNKETLISLYPELLIGIDDDAKILHIAAPEGYFSDSMI